MSPRSDTSLALARWTDRQGETTEMNPRNEWSLVLARMTDCRGDRPRGTHATAGRAASPSDSLGLTQGARANRAAPKGRRATSDCEMGARLYASGVRCPRGVE